MKSVYIVVTNTGSFANRAIKTVTSAPYNHASISLDDRLTNLYSFARRQPMNPFWGGFIKENVVTGTFSWFPNTTCEIYELNIPKRNYQKLERIISTFEKNENKYLYNYIGLLGIPINHPIEMPSSYFCSQFVAEVLRRSGYPLFDQRSSLISPDDFRKHPELRQVYQGELYSYPKLYSKNIYEPKQYHSFPFRKYMMQQFYTEVLGLKNKHERQFYFRDGFIKPKKIYLMDKVDKINHARKLLLDKMK
ncbi:hypothetical protein [Aquibacillus koreensis]|uniref:hypothetical protein n=1 Tax=Aquibacillus koreensis TaxID=279446 RepID=UPI00288325DB|nr:hypothetical protein [Aquibacillus koreensis]